MTTLLITQKRLREANLLLQHFKDVMAKSYDKTGLCWYHTLCMDILLDTGYTILSYEECDNFDLNVLKSVDNIRDKDATSRFYVNMWLW